MYAPLFRALTSGEANASPPGADMSPQRILKGLPSRAKGTSGDIIAHRDDDMFETLEEVRRERTTAVAATTSGDIIGHTSPLRSADLAWESKGRVGPDGSGNVLGYSHPAINPLRENPTAYSRYRTAGDIIGNMDDPDPSTRRELFTTQLRKFNAYATVEVER